MEQTRGSFPSFFPPKCPPPDAIFNEVKAFRFSENSKLTREDFLSQYEKKPDNKRIDPGYYAISIFIGYDNALAKLQRFRKAIPSFRNHNYMHLGITFSEYGIIKIDKDHVNWWLFYDKSPHQVFSMEVYNV